jgi:hypothetical protein
VLELIVLSLAGLAELADAEAGSAADTATQHLASSGCDLTGWWSDWLAMSAQWACLAFTVIACAGAVKGASDSARSDSRQRRKRMPSST